VLRDLDILKKIDKTAILPDDLKKLNHGAMITFSISTLDDKLARALEPGAPTPMERLETMMKCREEGFLAGVCYAPTLPFISDTEEEIDRMIKAAKDYGADYAFVGTLTLFGDGPADCKTLYYKFLERYYPDLIPKYRSLFRGSFKPPREYEDKLEERATKIRALLIRRGKSMSYQESRVQYQRHAFLSSSNSSISLLYSSSPTGSPGSGIPDFISTILSPSKEAQMVSPSLMFRASLYFLGIVTWPFLVTLRISPGISSTSSTT